MIPAGHRIRRATVEDLPGLKALLETMHLPTTGMERRITEFHVVDAPDGALAGAIGMQIIRQHGLVHSEAYHDFSLADPVRPLLLDRLRALASNHGVFRFWMREPTPFWKQNGFLPAPAEALDGLPGEWAADAGPAPWFTLQLKDEAALVSAAKEMEIFLEAEKQKTARTIRRARRLKWTVTFLVFAVGIVLLSIAAYLHFRRGTPLIP